MIDAHQHFWKYETAEFVWVTDDMALLRRDFLPEHLQQSIAPAGITGTIAVQARQSLAETDWLLSLASQNFLIKGVVGWVPLKDSAVGEVLDRLAVNPLFRGVREILQGAPDEQFFDCPKFHRGIRELTLRDIPYDLLILRGQIGRALPFVDAHPQQRFILDHLAKPEIRNTWDACWAGEIRELARRENVLCKFSGLTTEVRGVNWDARLILPYFETVIEAFGAARLMYGSDWPVCLLRTEYSQWLSAVTELAMVLSVDEREALFSGTAREAYSL